jgi:acyl carrier protein
MVPVAWVRLWALPLTTNGKVNRSVLPAPDADDTQRNEPVAAAQTPVEERVALIVATLLHLGQVGRDENFFLLGGHSLLGAQLLARVQEAFAIELPLRTLFDAPTVSGLSAEIARVAVARLEALSDEEAERLLA